MSREHLRDNELNIEEGLAKCKIIIFIVPFYFRTQYEKYYYCVRFLMVNNFLFSSVDTFLRFFLGYLQFDRFMFNPLKSQKI